MPSSEAIWRRIVPTRASSVPPALLVDQRDEAEADRQLERVERERLERGVARRRPARPGRRRAARAAAAIAACCSALFGLLAQRPADGEEQAADEQERDLRQARDERERA